MNILYVSYPMLPVSDASCGGAEQMLWTLEREMARRGHRTAVAACEGSRVSGELITTGEAPTAVDAFEMRARQHSRAVIRAVEEQEFDLVHDESGFFWQHAGTLDLPLLATLHLPRTFYEQKLFQSLPENVCFNCVSRSQARRFEDLPQMLDAVPNGIALERFRFASKKGDYALWLGRICPEKAPHLAIDAAERAGVRLVMAGQVYPFSWHQEYFEREVRPRLERADGHVRWVEKPSFAEKAKLLSEARALLLPTLAPETSSLVAMEAMACGTPVIAFPNGAVIEIVRNNVSGYLVKDVVQMAHAIGDLDRLWPEDARAIAEENFSARTMADKYENLYERIVSESQKESRLAA
ncbi:MAG TPA: glycosyltransferase family 4 protein [Terriglobales bacterium]|nr:glycosyltransferase family 4 protein [Terriglobales bacterium]